MAVLNPRNWVHENPRFGENEVKSLCKTFHLNSQEIHLGFIEYKSSGGRRISNKFNKLLVAVDTLSPSNDDCERGFSAMNNIINYRRSLITTVPPTCSWSALWDLPAKYGIQIHTSKHGLEKGEEQLTQQVARLVKIRKRIITMNLCGKLLNNVLYLCCGNLLTCGKWWRFYV